MSFPAAGVSVPSLSTYQFSYQGYKFGPGQPFEYTKFEGFDMPTVRNGDAGRPRSPGRFVGLDVLDGRDIAITGELLTVSSTAWTNLANAMSPGGTVEYPLYFASPFWGTLVTMVRPRKRPMPIDMQAALGNLVSTVLGFSGSDPRWYTTPTNAPSVSGAGTSAGFSFPLTFPLVFGGGSSVGELTVVNPGNIDIPAILTVTGPCTTPSITNASVPGSPNLTFGVTLNTGDQLVIDTDMHTATFFTAGSSLGSPRVYTLGQGSLWWTLWPANGDFTVPGGSNTIQFSSADANPTGTLTVASPGAAYIL